jgi:hypothetical protein
MLLGVLPTSAAASSNVSRSWPRAAGCTPLTNLFAKERLRYEVWRFFVKDAGPNLARDGRPQADAFAYSEE